LGITQRFVSREVISRILTDASMPGPSVR
jgi:hypothetical protein